MLHNPNATLEQFSEIIEVDEAWSSRLLKLANSAYFQRGQAATNIVAALQLIGLAELRCVLNAVILRDLFPSSHPLRMPLWTHNIAVANTALLLADSYAPHLQNDAFLAGLTHDIGKLLLLERSPTMLDAITRELAHCRSYPEAEELVTPFSHTVLGQALAEQWSFPEQVVKAIAWHHQGIDNHGAKKGVQLYELITLANSLVHSLAIGYSNRYDGVREYHRELFAEQLKALQLPLDPSPAGLAPLKRQLDSRLEEHLVLWE